MKLVHTRWKWDTWSGPSKLHFYAFPVPWYWGWRSGPLTSRWLSWGAGDMRHPAGQEFYCRVKHLQLGARLWCIGLQNWQPTQEVKG